MISKALQYGGNLTIPHLTKDDQGSYECVASNPVTNVITSSLLIIESTSEFPSPSRALADTLSSPGLATVLHVQYNFWSYVCVCVLYSFCAITFLLCSSVFVLGFGAVD